MIDLKRNFEFESSIIVNFINLAEDEKEMLRELEKQRECEEMDVYGSYHK